MDHLSQVEMHVLFLQLGWGFKNHICHIKRHAFKVHANLLEVTKSIDHFISRMPHPLHSIAHQTFLFSY